MLVHTSSFQPVDLSTGTISHLSSRFRWRIDNFSRLKNEVHFSDTFSFGSRKWRIMIYPRGNNSNHLSVSLEAGEFNMPSQGGFGFGSTGRGDGFGSTEGGFGFGSTGGGGDFASVASKTNPAFSSFSLASKDVQPSFGSTFGTPSSFSGSFSLGSKDAQPSFGSTGGGGASVAFKTNPAFSSFNLASKDVQPSFGSTFGTPSSSSGSFSLGSKDAQPSFGGCFGTSSSCSGNFSLGSKDAQPSFGGCFGTSSSSVDQISTEFSLAVVNQIHNKYTVRKEAKNKFIGRKSYFGFPSFMLLSELSDLHKGYIVDDTCIFEVEVAVLGGMENSTYDSKKGPSSDRSTQTELQVGVPIQVVAPIAEMDSTAKTVPGLATQSELEGKRNETVGVAEAHGEVHLEDQVTKSQDEVSVVTTQSGDTTPLPEYSGAGQLFEEGRHRQSFLDDKFEDIGGFTVLKTQASIYKQIWLKYGHIATSEILVDSYSGQVSVVSDIMTSVMCMHKHRFAEVSSAMIESWGKKIKMAEKLEFNIKWLQERFEDIKKDFYEEPKLKTALIEQDEAEVRLIAAEEEFILAKDELKKAEEKVLALKTRISPLHSGRQMYLEKGSSSVLDGLF